MVLGESVDDAGIATALLGAVPRVAGAHSEPTALVSPVSGLQNEHGKLNKMISTKLWTTGCSTKTQLRRVYVHISCELVCPGMNRHCGQASAGRITVEPSGLLQATPMELVAACLKDICDMLPAVAIGAHYHEGNPLWWNSALILSEAVENFVEIAYVLDRDSGKRRNEYNPLSNGPDPRRRLACRRKHRFRSVRTPAFVAYQGDGCSGSVQFGRLHSSLSKATDESVPVSNDACIRRLSRRRMQWFRSVWTVAVVADQGDGCIGSVQ